MHERVHVAHELLGERTIEPILRAQRQSHFLADVGVIEYRAEWIARREVDEGKGYRGDDRNDDRSLAEPTRKVAEHPLGSLLARRFRGRGRPSRRWRNAVSSDALVRRDRPVSQMSPPRIGSHRRQLQSRMISENLPRFRE